MRKILAAMVCRPDGNVGPHGCSGGPGSGEATGRRGGGRGLRRRRGQPVHHPDQACATGLAAGNSDTAIREYLLGKGYTAYTSPAMNGRGQVVDQQGFGAFGVCPVTLPENMTVNSTGSIDTAGEHLARFVNWLHDEKGVTEVDFVGHSMGGLYSRAAIRVLPPRTQGEDPFADDDRNTVAGLLSLRLRQRPDGAVGCQGDKFCESAVTQFKSGCWN